MKLHEMLNETPNLPQLTCMKYLLEHNREMMRQLFQSAPLEYANGLVTGIDMMLLLLQRFEMPDDLPETLSDEKM